MLVKSTQQKIAQLTELLNNPESDEGNVLRVFYELFQLSNEGRDLPLETLKWLNETASLFLSAQLVSVLTKLRLDVYGFKFAALNFIDIDDVIYDLSHGEILKSVHNLPPGAFNKLKRKLLEPSPPRQQQQPKSQPTVEKTHQQPSRRNHFAAPSSSSSSASISGNDSDQSVGEVDPFSDLVWKRGRLKGGRAFNTIKRDASAAGPLVPQVNPPLFAPTGSRPQGSGYSTHEPPFQPTQHPQFGTSPTSPGCSNYPSGMVPHRDGAPVCPPPGGFQRRASNVGGGLSGPHGYQINLQDQTTPSSSSNLTATDQQISTHSLLAITPEPQYSSVFIPTEGEDVLFDQHCKLYRFDDGILEKHGVGQLKLLQDLSTKKIRLLMRRDKALEICADHFITIDLKLLRAANKIWCIWSAVDYADDEKGKLHKFAVRFQTEEQCVEFCKAFEGAQSTLEKIAQQSFGNIFAPKPGPWSCDSCNVNNKAEEANCVSCEAIKPVAHIPVSSAAIGASMTSTTSTAGMLFSLLPRQEPTPAFTTGSSGTGVAVLASNLKSSEDSERKLVDSNAPSVTGKFHPTLSMDPTSKGLIGIGFGGSNLTMNNGTIAANSDKSGSSATISVGSEEEIKSSKPVSLLSEEVLEDDEELVYRQHAELFRFSDGEWKQHGSGYVNILRHKSTGKTRFLMKREKTSDICLNHEITSALIFRPEDDKSWLCVARDFSDGVGKIEAFVIRLRDAETAEAFMTVVLENQQNGESVSNGDHSKENVKCIPDDDEKGVTNRVPTPVTSSEEVHFSGAMKAANSSSVNTPFLRPDSPGFFFGLSASFPAFGFNLKSASSTFSGTEKQIFQQSTAGNFKDSRRTITAKRSKTLPAAIDPPATESTTPSKKDVEDGKETVMFDKDCTLYLLDEGLTEKNWVMLGSSNVKIVFNDRMRCYRVIAQDGNQQCLCDIVISMETELKVDGFMCTWSAFDYSKKESCHRTFLAQFNQETQASSNTDAAVKFKSVFAKGKRFAEKSNIHDPHKLQAVGYDSSSPAPGKSS